MALLTDDTDSVEARYVMSLCSSVIDLFCTVLGTLLIVTGTSSQYDTLLVAAKGGDSSGNSLPATGDWRVPQ